ncbi:MAG: hypothetical protein ACR2N0_18125 [Rubrobacteraceae bacterium]
MHAVKTIWGRCSNYLAGLFFAFAVMLGMAYPALAQADDLASGARAAAVTAVSGGAAVALVILAAVILYRIIKRFAS